ncbi:MAG: ACP S-malonyltransferase [Oligosphaeraceae bacterium]
MRVGFMFAGQGAQAPGMGKDLYEGSAAARAVFEEADEVLGRSLSRLCFEGSVEELTLCANCQPAIYVMSCACLAALRERVAGLSPTCCGGLSLGELSALCAAGVFGFGDGLRLVAKRGELMDAACRATSGAMAAVLGGDVAHVAEVCASCGIDVANYNCPGQVVVSGESGGVDAAVSRLAAEGLRTVRLTVAGAYHSRLMAGAAAEFVSFLSGVPLSRPACAVMQNVPGGEVTEASALRENLGRQVCSPVRWESCARAMMSRSELLVEFGPGNVLCGFLKRMDRAYPSVAVNSLSGLDAAAARICG